MLSWTAASPAGPEWQSQPVAVQHREKNDERGSAHQEGDEPLFQVIKKFHGNSPEIAAWIAAARPRASRSIRRTCHEVRPAAAV
jgi:hypothetical protein